MNYWTASFTYSTWTQRDQNILCWSVKRRTLGERLQPGDLIIGYVARIGFVGYWRALSRPRRDPERSPYGERYPLIVDVEPVIELEAATAYHVEDLPTETVARVGRTGRIMPLLHQRSGTSLQSELGEEIVRLLTEWSENPRRRRLTEAQRSYQPRTAEAHQVEGTTVSVPAREEDEQAPETEELLEEDTDQPVAISHHTSAQEKLCRLGRMLGFTPWITPDDKSRQALPDGTTLEALPGVTSDLPAQFDPTTTSTIRHIDAMWLTRSRRRDRIEAAFEVEQSTSIHSGILRMADLLALQPNLDIPLYLVVPEERAEKAAEELVRPVFQFGMETPLSERARVITYGQLDLLLDLAERAGGHLKRDVLEEGSYAPGDLLPDEA